MGKAAELREVEIAALKPYERNAKQHSAEQVAKIADSIRRLGFISPCLIDRDLNVIAGHGRIMAAKKAGMESVPCVFVEGLTEEERRAYILADNRLTELGDWDMDMVQQELTELVNADFDIDITGFDISMDFTENSEKENADEWVSKDEAEEPKSKLGQVYKLGRHRLMCGDSTDREAVQKLFDGDQPFCIVTDPPYCSGGFQESGKKGGSIGTRDKLMIANDTLSTRGYMALIKSVMLAAGDIGIAYVFTDWRMWINLFDCMESSGFGVRNMIVWDKGTPGMGIGWRAQHEICLMASRAAQKFNPHKAEGNVIKCKRTGNVNHPTEKPVELIARIIDVTDFAKTIYDPFSGSGTTLLACESLGRKCYSMELDPHYVDVIIDRWEKMTGKKAELVSSYTTGGGQH